jgi:hypothetical protein
MNGRSTSGTTGLGTVEVSGRRRVPLAAREDQRLHQASSSCDGRPMAS